MKPVMVQVNETKNPFIQEGLYTFPEFEHHARIAATNTPPNREHNDCVDVIVMFHEGHHMSCHLHLNKTGDLGILDWIGNVLGRRELDEQTQQYLTSVEKTIH